MEGPPRYPLEIFPKEIWEMIILKVEDSEDLRNLMKASKPLNAIFMEIRHLWLLDKVLPILTSTPTGKKERYLEDEDVKNLRLVDKRWCGAVDTFLQNQPTLRPYDKYDDKLNSEKHVWSRHSSQNEFRDSTNVGRVVLYNNQDQLSRSSEMIEALEEFRKSERNPFPLRSVIRFTELDEPANIWGELDQDVSQKIGNHVWFLTVAMSWDEDDDTFRSEPNLVWKWIVNSLRLPNLKSLRLILHSQKCLMDYLPESVAKKFLESEENQLPPLPSLESLAIINFQLYPALLTHQLVSKYSLQLKRLLISTLVWETREKWAFPNLTELYLDGIVTSMSVTEIVKSLDAPQLAKLALLAGRSLSGINLEVENDIFTWITLLPSLLLLDISCNGFSISEIGTLEPPQDTKPSLKYLKIHNSHGVDYNFLRCLPSLQRLQISVDEEPVVWDCSAYPEVKVKLEIETNSLYQSNVWDLCLKLKSLSIYTEYDTNRFEYKEFDRATYEKLKNNPEPEIPKCVKLRREIRRFLKLFTYSDSDLDSEDEDEFVRYFVSEFLIESDADSDSEDEWETEEEWEADEDEEAEEEENEELPPLI